jgi:hypothetical protein
MVALFFISAFANFDLILELFGRNAFHGHLKLGDAGVGGEMYKATIS